MAREIPTPIPTRSEMVAGAGGSDDTFSVVAPVYDEQESLPRFYQRVTAVMERLGEPFELILVDDGSRDATPQLLRALAERDPPVRVLRFSRNFGHQTALTAGLDAARGGVVITLDADLQDPPELIPLLVAQWRQGAEIVYAQHARRRGESAFKRLTAAAYYRLLTSISTVAMPRDTGDFRLMDRRVVDALVGMREQHRYLRGLAAWVGFRQVVVPFERPARLAGTTKFSLGKMLRLAADGILGFSYAPLELATAAGVLLAALTLLAGITLGALALAGWQIATWWVVVLPLIFLGAVQLVCLGLLGTYLGRVYDEVRGRPRYILRETIERPGVARPANTMPAREVVAAPMRACDGLAGAASNAITA